MHVDLFDCTLFDYKMEKYYEIVYIIETWWRYEMSKYLDL